MLPNAVLWSTLGSKSIEEVNNEELGSLFTLSNIIGVINLKLFKTTRAVKKHEVLVMGPSRFIYIYIYIQGVTGGTDQTSGECTLGQTIPL